MLQTEIFWDHRPAKATNPIPSELVKSGGRAPTATARSKSGYNKPLSDVWFDIAKDRHSTEPSFSAARRIQRLRDHARDPRFAPNGAARARGLPPRGDLVDL